MISRDAARCCARLEGATLPKICSDVALLLLPDHANDAAFTPRHAK
jgi:hypothetical protein